MSLGECWTLPNGGYVVVGPTSDSITFGSEGDAPIRFITNSHQYARFWNGVWLFDPIHTPAYFTGNSWLDSDHKTFIDVPWENLVHFRKGVLATQTDTITRANSVSELSLIGVGLGSTVLPANYLTAGKTLHIKSRGTLAVTGTPTIEIKLFLDGTTIVGTGAVNVGVLVGTQSYEIDLLLTYRGGGSNEVAASGYFRIASTFYAMSGTPITIDPTVPQTLDLTVQWGTASASNTISSTHFVLET